MICIWGTFDLLVFKAILMSFGAFVSEWTGTRKRLAIERNRVNLALEDNRNMSMGYLDLLVFNVILVSFGALVSKWPVIRKTAGCRARLSEIWESEVVVICIWGIFRLLVLKVILGSFGVLVSK